MGGYAYPLASPGESNRYFRLATDATTEESILAEVHYLEISIRSGGSRGTPFACCVDAIELRSGR